MLMKKKLSHELLGEIFGTFILILLGDGVVAHVGLAPRLAASAYDWNTIALGWAFAVIVAVYVSGGISGAHLNPGVTLSLALRRGFPWAKVGPYILAQMIGAFLGAAAVYLSYREGLLAAGVPNVWCTGPGSIFTQAFWGGGQAGAGTAYSLFNACCVEFIGTMVLLWGILAAGDSKNMGLTNNLGPMLVGFTVLAIGLSLGGPSGYAINPARDLGPRIFGALIGSKGLFDGWYWLTAPVLIPMVAAPLAVVVYDAIATRACTDKTIQEN
jgi:glycerol uptake facilitator protein